MNDYRNFIKEEFEIRKMTNKSYSLRSYARDLELESSHLSRILSGKKGLSAEKAELVSNALGLVGKELELFFALIEKEHGRSKKAKIKAEKFLQATSRYSKVDLGLFQLISDWEFYAIITAMQLDHYTGSVDWLSGHLNISTERVQQCIDLFVDLEFVKEVEGKYLSENFNFETDTDIPSVSLRKSHKQNILQAIEAIDLFDVDQRDITSMTMAIDNKKLPEAKRKVAKFTKELCQFLESGKKNSVYNMNIQLYPLSKKEFLQ